MNRIAIALCFFLGALPMFIAFHAGESSAATPVHLTMLEDAGASAAAHSSADLPNPVLHPGAAWNDWKATKKTGWPLAVFAGLVFIGKGLAYGKDKLGGVPLLGRLAAWLAVGRRATALAAIGTIGAAGYDVLRSGGSLSAAVIAAGVAFAGLLQPVHPAPAASS